MSLIFDLLSFVLILLMLFGLGTSKRVWGVCRLGFSDGADEGVGHKGLDVLRSCRNRFPFKSSMHRTAQVEMGLTGATMTGVTRTILDLSLEKL